MEHSFSIILGNIKCGEQIEIYSFGFCVARASSFLPDGEATVVIWAVKALRWSEVSSPAEDGGLG